MLKLDDKAAINGIAKNGAAIWFFLRQHLAPDCCIAATGLLIGALPEFEITPMPTVAHFSNYQLIDLIHKHGEPKTETMAKQFADMGAYQIVIGKDGSINGTKWCGHLVAIMTATKPQANGHRQRWLIDLSIPQANRPNHNIVITSPIVKPLTHDQGLKRGDHITVINQGFYGFYNIRPDMRGYRNASDWRNRQQHAAISAGIRQIIFAEADQWA